MNIRVLFLLLISLITLSSCSLEVTIGTFLSTAFTNEDFTANVVNALYWGKSVYRFIKDVKAMGEAKPNLGKVSKELEAIDVRLQSSLKEITQILLDQHFQTHIELPAFTLYRHTIVYISNPTDIHEKELTEICTHRLAPNDVLSSLLFMMQKQWLLHRFKDLTYDEDNVTAMEEVIETLIKKLVVTQSLCLELRYSLESDDYRQKTINLVKEIKETVLQQTEKLKKTLKAKLQMPCKPKKQNGASESVMLAIIKSPWYLLKAIYRLFIIVIRFIYLSIYYLITNLINVLMYILASIYAVIVYVFQGAVYLLKGITTILITIVKTLLYYPYIALSFLCSNLYYAISAASPLLIPLVVSSLVTLIYDDIFGEQRFRNFLRLE